MRKALYLLLGVTVFFVGLFAYKFYDIVQNPIYTSPPLGARIEDLVDDLLQEENRNGDVIDWTPSMETLVEIGEPVVPDLIEAIETAHDRAASKTYKARILQIRSAMVLGKIGDQRILPVLMSLRCTDNIFLCRDIDKAIKNLEQKSDGKETKIE